MENLNQGNNTANAEEVITKITMPETVVEEPVTPKPEVVPPVVEPVKPAAPKAEDTVVLYSIKELPKISKGYSRVSNSVAKELLKNPNVRLASAEEIKEYFNK